MTIIDKVTYNGLVLKRGFSERELNDIRALQQACEVYDGIRLKLNWSLLQKRGAEAPGDALFYEQGKLIGFAALYAFYSHEAELTGMVHPEKRRRGIFGQLAGTLENAALEQGFRDLIWFCPRASAAGRRFLEAKGVPYVYSEYVMERGEDAGTAAPAAVLQLRQAGHSDLALLAKLNSSGFEMTMEEGLELALKSMSDMERCYIAEVDGEAVGKINVLCEAGRAHLFAFVVSAEKRGMGYGRAMLSSVIELMQTERGLRRFSLEVAASNERALGLYRSCGFETVSIMDYYKSPLK
ncbi:GNAT family N-acetyltransferase [Paenibacillus chartarius]|uniref:GNAT family N-acetyltransferase n=1 Tax=Paenibacillus chartarius TaxID=747481 RepID=A0ABV6DSD0_9BACL